MKKAKILLSLLLGVALIGSAFGIAACNKKDPEPDPKPGTSDLTFESSSAASIDEKAFELSLVMKADKTLALTAECTGEAQQGGGPGGKGDKGDKGDKGGEGGEQPGDPEQGGEQGGEQPGGPEQGGEQGGQQPGGPEQGGEQGGQQPGGPEQGGQPAMLADEAPSEGEDEEEEEIDYSKYNYTKSGTWSEEEGYGYIFVLDGETIHVNYDVYQSAHYFYYAPTATIDGKEVKAASAVRMSAMDVSYQQKLAADYEIYEARTCTYHFYGGADSVGGNLNVTDLYLLPGGVAVDMTGRDSVSYSQGTWSEANGVITVKFGEGEDEETYTSEKSTAGDGYRIDFGSYFIYTADKDGNFLGEEDFAA